jgi:hypothetical protein
MGIFIYYLHKGDNIPFYIGKSNSPKTRLKKHQVNFGGEIQIEILDEVSIEDWKFWERYYISLFKTWGFILENKNKGGGGISGFELVGKKHTEETKLFMSQAKKGKSSNRKGKSCSEEHKMKLSQSMKSKEKSPLKGILYHTFESKRKIGEIHKNKNISEEQKAAISKAQKGKKLSEAHIQAMIEGKKRKKLKNVK